MPPEVADGREGGVGLLGREGIDGVALGDEGEGMALGEGSDGRELGDDGEGSDCGDGLDGEGRDGEEEEGIGICRGIGGVGRLTCAQLAANAALSAMQASRPARAANLALIIGVLSTRCGVCWCRSPEATRHSRTRSTARLKDSRRTCG